MLADEAYDPDRIRELIQEQGSRLNIPPQRNRKGKRCSSTRLYRERYLIGRFISKLKHFRRFATRYDKLAASFLSFSGSNCGLMSLRPISAIAWPMAGYALPIIRAEQANERTSTTWRNTQVSKGLVVLLRDRTRSCYVSRPNISQCESSLSCDRCRGMSQARGSGL